MSDHDDGPDPTDGTDGDGRTAPSALSRRAVLAGGLSLGAIGAASGGGSVLLLSDRTLSSDDVIEGGQMDLRVAWQSYGADGAVREERGVCDGSFEEYVDTREPAVELEDAEPGDSGRLVVCAQSQPPDRDVWARVVLWSAAERGRGPAERGAGDDDPAGELQHHLDVVVRRTDECDPGFDGTDLVQSGHLADVAGHPMHIVSGDPSPTCLLLEWELPEGVPSTVRSDSVSFGVQFAVVGSRGDEATNPWGGGS